MRREVAARVGGIGVGEGKEEVVSGEVTVRGATGEEGTQLGRESRPGKEMARPGLAPR